MRLPLAKIYRAFPELDRFSDEECRGFVAQASKAGLDWTTAARAAGGVFTISAFLIAIPLSMTIGALTGAAIWGVRGPRPFWMGLSLLVGITVPLVGNLMLRDFVLRRRIRRRLLSAECAACRYSLLGLAWRDGLVKCPECGTSNDLRGRGLKPEDLIAGSADSSATPSSSPPPA